MLDKTYPENLYLLAKTKKLPHAVIIESENVESAANVAVSVAKTAMCLAEDKPCGNCENCFKINAGSHTDVKILSPQGGASKSIKVEDIRFLREDAFVVSNEGSYKFYIIKNADDMTVQAQNAFIKILEEPPKNVVFMLVCKFASSLLTTVISRCQIFKSKVKNSCFGEISDIAKKIAQCFATSKEFDALALAAKIPNDRKFLKELLELTLENILKLYANKKFESITNDDLINKIDEIKYIISLIDKNVNFNLLVCYFCACV